MRIRHSFSLCEGNFAIVLSFGRHVRSRIFALAYGEFFTLGKKFIDSQQPLGGRQRGAPSLTGAISFAPATAQGVHLTFFPCYFWEGGTSNGTVNDSEESSAARRGEQGGVVLPSRPRWRCAPPDPISHRPRAP